MRLTVKLRLAWQTMPGGGKWLTTAVLALATFFLVVSGSLAWQLQQEQGEPCEIRGSLAETAALSAEQLTALYQREGVQAVTWAGEAELTLSFGEYQATVMACGVEASWLRGDWQQGQAYADQTAMPYVVLNAAAVQSFRNEKKAVLEQPETVSWCEAEMVVKHENGGSPLRICGVLEDGEEEARAYLSTEQLQNLMAAAGQEGVPDMLWLRLENVSYREVVCRELQTLGISAESGEDRETRWQILEERRNLYLLMGILAAACGCLVHFNQEKNRSIKQPQIVYACRQNGYPMCFLPMLARWHFVLVCLIGVLVGGVAGIFYLWG